MLLFQSLPAYFGGKRRLLGHVFRDLQNPTYAPTFVDAFLGGGSVSLYAKVRGYRVICNDVAERSFAIGKALIENDHTLLTYDDLIQLSIPTEEIGYAEQALAPEVFPIDHAHYLDLFLANAERLHGNKRWLARLLIIKHALRLRPMGNFGAKKIMLQAAAGQWEDMNPNYVKDLVSRGLPRHPIRLAEKLLPKINAGVFANGQENEAHKGDVFRFLKNVTGDICYMDPPYSNSLAYERSMHPLDELLNGGSVKIKPNPFSTQKPEEILPRLFAAADHIPTLVISYGNKDIDLLGLMDLMRQHRPNVTGQAIKFRHCTGLSSAERNKNNQELLVIGRSE